MPELVADLLGADEGGFSGAGKNIEPFAFAAAGGGGFAEFAFDEAFFLEAIEDGMNDAEFDGAVRMLGEFVADGNAVGVIHQGGDGEQDELLEFAEVGSFHTFIYSLNVCNIA